MSPRRVRLLASAWPRAREEVRLAPLHSALKGWQTAAIVYGLVTIAFVLPLLPQFGSGIPHDAGDPILNTWILWWGSRTVPFTEPWWDAPMFFPMADALALSELLVGLLPISLVVQMATGNPQAAYNAAFVLSFPLCGLAAYALVRDLSGTQGAAIAGGFAFMLAPYRMQQLGHLQVLSYYWAPLVLLALHRFARERRRRWLVVFAVSWLLQGLTNGYAIFHVSVLVGLWVLWFMRPLRTAVPIVLAGGCAAVPLAIVLWKYRTVHDTLHLVRDINEIKRFGADLADVFAAAPDLALWGERLGLARPETALFPGATVIVLGLVALFHARRRAPVAEERAARWRQPVILISAVAAAVALSALVVGPWAIGPLTVREFHKPFSIAVAARLAAFLGGPWVRRGWRDRSVVTFYVLAAAAMYVLALGPEPRLLGRPLIYEPPYAWLMRVPGFDVLRVPARFAMLGVLCQAVLVGLAVAAWAQARWRAPLVAVIITGIAADGWVRLPVAPPPAAGVTAWGDVAAVLELPLAGGDTDFGAIHRAMAHGLPIVNGYSGYLPPHYLPLAHAIRDRQWGALREVARAGTIGVAIDRASAGGRDLEAALRREAYGPGPIDDRFATFVVPSEPAARDSPGPRLPVVSARATMHGEDAGRMLDDDVRTAWGSGVPQIGGEEVVLDLGASQRLGTIVLAMGAFSFGHPRSLEIDISPDGVSWSRAWTGDTSVPTVRAALAEPGVVPVAFPLTAADARYVRLRQTGNEPGIPWWIADVRVHAP